MLSIKSWTLSPTYKTVNLNIYIFSLLQILLCLVCSVLNIYAQTRGNPRIQTNTQQMRGHSDDIPDYDEDNQSENLRYYDTASGKNGQHRVVLITADNEYNGLYGHPTPTIKSRADFNRPVPKSTSNAARSKETNPKETVQTIRNYSTMNDDGSFTFGKIYLS